MALRAFRDDGWLTDPRWFGAKGDGAHDDTAAFVLALERARSLGAPIKCFNTGEPYVVAVDTIVLDWYGAGLICEPGTQLAFTGVGNACVAADGRAAKTVITAVDVGTSTFTSVGHGFQTGAGPVLWSSTGLLPGNIVNGGFYWIIRVGPDEFQVAVSYADAIAGNAFVISGAGSGVRSIDLFLNRVYVDQPVIIGGAGIDYGLFVRNCHRSVFSNVDARNVVAAGFGQLFGVANELSRFICSVNTHTNDWTTVPARGIKVTNRLDDGANPDHSEVLLITNPIVEGISAGPGIYLDACDTTRIVAGTSEGNNMGIQLTGNGGIHTVASLFMEGNMTADIDCASFWSRFENCLSLGLTRFLAGAGPGTLGSAYGNILAGGRYNNVTNASAYKQLWDGFVLGGALVDAVPTPGRYWNVAAADWVVVP